MKYVFTILLFLTSNLYADTYLCVGETGAGVENTGPAGFKSKTYDVSNQKLILNNKSGKWILKKLGKDTAVFDNCLSEYMCMMKEGFSGIFTRNDNGVFTYILNQAYGPEYKTSIMLTVKGLCSKL